MEQINRVLLLIASAVAYALAFPPFGWWPLALLSLGVLIGVFHDIKPAHGFRLGFLWGMVAFGTGLSWLWNLFGVFSLALWAILSVYPAVFGWLVVRAKSQGMKGTRLALWVALAWTTTEFLRCEVMPLRFPWLNAGLALEPWPLVSWLGVYGLGLIVVWLVAAAVFGRWRVVLALLVLLAFGAMNEPRLFKAPHLKVALVQAETAPLSTYLQLTQQAPPGTQLIVWPEYAVAKDIQRAAADELATIQQAASTADALLVFGTQTRLEGAKWQNTALTVDGSQVLGEHGKNHTVHFFDDGERGPTATAIQTTLGKLGTPICFDCDFQDVVRRMTLAGAEFFAVPSMDAANWSARQHIQHAQLFRVRAAENRRCMAVAASSGVSQIINPTGRATASLAAMQQGTLSGTIMPLGTLTCYTRWGWLTPWVAMAALLVWTIKLLALSKEKMPQPVDVLPV